MTRKFDYNAFKAEVIKEIPKVKSFSGGDNVLLPMIQYFLEGVMIEELDFQKVFTKLCLFPFSLKSLLRMII